jgi:hypothetical protein
MTIGRIVLDSPREILANKLCALLSRTELRDLVDVARLQEAGHDPIAALDLAAQKEAGMTAAQLAWVLSSFPVPADESGQYGMSQNDLDDFLSRSCGSSPRQPFLDPLTSEWTAAR